MKLLWEEKAWEEYCYWQTQDKKTLKRINILIKDIQRNSYEGIGKPEQLTENLQVGGADALTKSTELSIAKKTEQLLLPLAVVIMMINLVVLVNVVRWFLTFSIGGF